jgi:AraC-like DNA-binding protein
LLEAPGPSAKFRLLEDFLIQELSRCGRVEDRRRSVEWAVGCFIRQPHLQSISAVCRQVGFSQKHFIEQFRRQVGLTPKRFCRVRRFQKVLEQIGSNGSVDWAEVAFACGYYDQAHFINDFRAFSGLKPSAYLSKRLEYPSFASAD